MQGIRDQALLADIFFGVSGLFAVTSVVLAFLTDFGDSEEESAGLSWSPMLSLNGGGLRLGGQF